MDTGYSEHEWATLLFAPLWVFQAAAARDEMDEQDWEALAQACRAARAYRNALSEDVFAELAAHFAELRAGFERDEADVSDGLAEVVALLKGEDETTAWGFKADMVAMAMQVARTLGGWLRGAGVGSEEKQLIGHLCSVLDIDEREFRGPR
ncbi:MAG: hypothetical protein KKA73_25740 [Chloroflexi bacterium]|nr:hypothetical protein [Chloroflexota bacterium]MBU1751101.1 hypothetical protein [Chloroflexota bacterium]